MRFRLRVPRVRRVFRSRRLVVVLAVAALVAGAGVSSASAASTDPKTVSDCVGQTPPIADPQVALCLQLLADLARKADLEPRDLAVAAPSSVIAATSSETPEIRTQQVSRWRPNPQAWIDAKSQLATSTGLTTADLSRTGRWQPVITKAGAIGRVVGLATGDTLLTWVAREGMMYPMLEQVAGIADARDMVEGAYCNRYGNFATDFVASWVGADCASWRADIEAFDSSARLMVPLARCYEGACLTIGGFENVWVAQTRLDGYSTSSNRSHWTVCRLRTGDNSAVSFRLTATWSDGVSTAFGASGRFEPRSCSEPFDAGAAPVLADYYLDTPTLNIEARVGSEPYVSLGTSVGPGSDLRPGKWTTDVRCLDGSVVTTSTATGSLAGGLLGAPPSVAPGGTCTPVGVDVSAEIPGASPAKTSISSAEVPTAVQDWMTDFPDCWDGSCLLELRKVIGGSLELECFDAPGQCVDWQTSVAADPATYRCYYGGSLVPISECNVYGKVFDRDKVQQGTGYTDPATGQPVTTSTGTAVTTNPGAATVAMSSGVSDPSQPRQCFPTGWGAFNPFEWVFQPVKCALEWAFVPRATKLSQVQTKVQLAAVNSVPAQMVQGLNGWTAAVPTSSGCMGPLVQFDVAGLNYSAYPLQACDGALATAANFSRIALTIIAILTGIIAITRYVARIFGFSGVGEGGSA